MVFFVYIQLLFPSLFLSDHIIGLSQSIKPIVHGYQERHRQRTSCVSNVIRQLKLQYNAFIKHVSRQYCNDRPPSWLLPRKERSVKRAELFMKNGQRSIFVKSGQRVSYLICHANVTVIKEYTIHCRYVRQLRL